MFLWVEPLMWTLCGALGYGCQLIGFVGLLAFAFTGILNAIEALIGEEDEENDFPGESDHQ